MTYFNCEICKKENIPANYFPTHLIKEHNIIAKEYYINFISKTHKIPLCKNCGNSLENRFHSLSSGFREFCSRSCQVSFNNKKNWKNEEYKNIHSKASSLSLKKTWIIHKEQFSKNSSDKMKKLNEDKEIRERQLKSKEQKYGQSLWRQVSKSRLLTLDKIANRDKRYLYLLRIDNNFYKVGTAVSKQRILDIEKYHKVEVLYFLLLNNELVLNKEVEFLQDYIVYKDFKLDGKTEFINPEKLQYIIKQFELLKSSETIM